MISLACAAALLVLFSWLGSLDSTSPRMYLRGVAVLNAMYCIATIGICVACYSRLTIWGVLYFSAEVIIVLSLAWWEWSVSRKIQATIV